MKLIRVFAVAVVAAGVYFRFLRAPILTWGATDSEAGARLAGDELLEDADGGGELVSTAYSSVLPIWYINLFDRQRTDDGVRRAMAH